LSSDQIDKLCLDWLSDNCGEMVAKRYRSYSLVIATWNTPDLNDGLESLKQILCIIFGPDESFGSTDYHEARKKLGLRDEMIGVPEIFIIAFNGNKEPN